MSFSFVKIKDCVDKISNWNPITEGSDQVITYIDLSAVDKDIKKITNVVNIEGRSAPSRARQLVKNNDVLVSTVRPNLNGVAKVYSSLDGATASTGFTVLRAKKDILDSSYLFHWVKTSNFINDMVSKATGQSYPAVSDKTVLNSEIPLPPIEEQRRIASILDKVDTIRQKRQQAIAKLDELLQATFIDMFGDPVSNPKGWKTAKLSELVSKDITYGVLKPEEFTQDGIPMLRIQDINSVNLSKVNNFHLISERLSQQYKRTVLEGNEIVISLVGTIGLVAKVPMSFKGFNVHRNLGVISLKDQCKVDFLESLMKLPHFKVLLEGCTKGGVHKLLNLSDLRNLPIYLPESKLIAEYIKILTKITKLKIDAYSSFEYQDKLFKSLQQKAFSGTL